MWHWPRPWVDRRHAAEPVKRRFFFMVESHREYGWGSELIWGTVPRGIPCRAGYHRTGPGAAHALDAPRSRGARGTAGVAVPLRRRCRRNGNAPSAGRRYMHMFEETLELCMPFLRARRAAAYTNALRPAAAPAGAGVAQRPQRTLSPLRCAALLHAAEAAAGRTRSRSLRIASLRGCL